MIGLGHFHRRLAEIDCLAVLGAGVAYSARTPGLNFVCRAWAWDVSTEFWSGLNNPSFVAREMLVVDCSFGGCGVSRDVHRVGVA